MYVRAHAYTHMYTRRLFIYAISLNSFTILLCIARTDTFGELRFVLIEFRCNLNFVRVNRFT